MNKYKFAKSDIFAKWVKEKMNMKVNGLPVRIVIHQKE